VAKRRKQRDIIREVHAKFGDDRVRMYTARVRK
jgi:hypothetical protein